MPRYILAGWNPPGEPTVEGGICHIDGYLFGDILPLGTRKDEDEPKREEYASLDPVSSHDRHSSWEFFYGRGLPGHLPAAQQAGTGAGRQGRRDYPSGKSGQISSRMAIKMRAMIFSTAFALGRSTTLFSM